MVNYKHVLERDWRLGKPVNASFLQWHQSRRFKPWEKQVRLNPDDFEMRYSLTNGTAEIVPKSNQKRMLSDKGKNMLKEKLEEIEAFNTSSMCAAFKRLNTKNVTRKEKRARCFICKQRGHVLWKCPDKKSKHKGETKAVVDKELKYPEIVHVKTDYMVEGSAKGNWIKIWSVATVETRNGYMVTHNHNRCAMRNMFDKEKGAVDMEEETELDYGKSSSMVERHNKFLEDYFESIDPKIDQKEERSLIKGMEDLKIEKKDYYDYVDDQYLSMNGTLYAMKVNTFPRFISFLDLIKINKLVYENWEVLEKKFMEMLEWFYLGFLGQDVLLGKLPPVIGYNTRKRKGQAGKADNRGRVRCTTGFLQGDKADVEGSQNWTQDGHR
ncbi:ARID DNA-binding domain-containing protein [Tanacetum coccineum]